MKSRALALLTLLSAVSHAAPAESEKSTSPEAAARIAWWQDAKFGLFIHWGPVSVAGTEIGWSRGGERRGYGTTGNVVPAERYDNLYKEFNPVAFNPSEWAAVAKSAGMKYVVFTTRHHDGFSLWDTQASDYKITSPHSPYRKDIVGPLADATRAAGLAFGAYYSQPDWHHADAFTDRHANYQAYLAKQLRELMTDCGRVDILWFDGLGKSAADYGAPALHQMIRELQPQILINNRNGLPEDFDTPEQRVGNMEVKRPWETCMTLCRQWAWKPDDKMKSLDECLNILIATVTGGGNLLLNIGPMPDGRIEPRQVGRLKEIGAWMEQNGVAIYNTRGGPWTNGSWGGSTYRDRTIYVHLLQPPLNGRLRLAAIPQQITSARLLHGASPVPFTQTDSGVTLDLGANAWQGPVTILELSTADPVAPYLILGLASGPFDDKSAFGMECQSSATLAASSGKPVKDKQNRWTVHTQKEGKPSVILDLGKVREITAFSANGIGHNAYKSNAILQLALSIDGETWEEFYQDSYGLPKWEVAITRHVAGIQQPGRPARYVRAQVDFGTGSGSLQLGQLSLYAR